MHHKSIECCIFVIKPIDKYERFGLLFYIRFGIRFLVFAFIAVVARVVVRYHFKNACLLFFHRFQNFLEHIFSRP